MSIKITSEIKCSIVTVNVCNLIYILHEEGNIEQKHLLEKKKEILSEFPVYQHTRT